jgi:hypothetical protein
MTTRKNLPVTGSPGAIVELRDAKGGPIQKRFFGADGRALKNIDYDHDHGAGKPRAHDWDWTKSPPRQAGRALAPGE